jgi:glycosyltransferase involved in cell wall biosynthesis
MAAERIAGQRNAAHHRFLFMSSARLLVVSPPCHQPVNRAVYRELAEMHGIAVHLAVPERLNVGGLWRNTPQAESTAYSLSLHPISGTHGRLQKMRGLAEIAARWRPTHVLVDSDPASLMVREAARACPDAQVWALTAENLRTRYFVECAIGISRFDLRRAAAPLLKLGLRLLVHPLVDRVFTLSRDGSRVMATVGFSDRVTQIPLGFDPALFRVQDAAHIAATRAKLGLQAPTIAYFGRLTPEKGVHILVEALAQIRGRPWQLLIDRFSDYPTAYVDTIRSRIDALALQDRVVYFDAHHEQMPDYMNAADIVVLPSLSTPRWKEQYGRVLPEAMACGKRVIGSDSGAIPELVAGYGRIVAEGDVTKLRDALANELDRAHFDVGREAISAFAHAHLSIRRQAAIWADLLK